MPCQGNHDHAHPHDTAPHKPQPNPHPQGEAQEALAINNKARAEKHLNPLQWDDKLASDAQQWANHLAQTQQMVHSSGDQRPGQGENLFAGMGKDYTFSDGVNSWLGEEKDYHGEKIGEGDFEKWGHYSEFIFPLHCPWGFSFGGIGGGGACVE